MHHLISLISSLLVYIQKNYPSEAPVAQTLIVLNIVVMNYKKIFRRETTNIRFSKFLHLIIPIAFLFQKQVFFSILTITINSLFKINRNKEDITHDYTFLGISVIITSLMNQIKSLYVWSFLLLMQDLVNILAYESKKKFSKNKDVIKVFNRISTPQIALSFLTIIATSYFSSFIKIDFFSWDKLSILQNSFPNNFFASMFLLSVSFKIILMQYSVWSKELKNLFQSSKLLFFISVPVYPIIMGMVKFTFVYCQNLKYSTIPTVMINIVIVLICSIASYRQKLLTRFLVITNIIYSSVIIFIIYAIEDIQDVSKITEVSKIIIFFWYSQFISSANFILCIEPIMSKFKNITSLEYVKGIIKREPLVGINLTISAISLGSLIPLTTGFFSAIKVLKIIRSPDLLTVFLLFLAFFAMLSIFHFSIKIVSYICFSEPSQRYVISANKNLTTLSSLLTLLILAGSLVSDFIFWL